MTQSTLTPIPNAAPFDPSRTDRAEFEADQLKARITPRATRTLMLLQEEADCIKIIEGDGTISFLNFNGMCALQIDDLNAVMGRQWADLWPLEHRSMIREALRAAATGATVHFVADCPTAMGRPARWDVTVTGVLDASKKLQEIVGISRLTSEPVCGLTTI